MKSPAKNVVNSHTLLKKKNKAPLQYKPTMLERIVDSRNLKPDSQTWRIFFCDFFPLLFTSFHFFLTKSCLKIVDSRPTQVILEIGRKKRVVFFGFFSSSGKTLYFGLEVLENQQLKHSTLPQDLSRIWMHCRL